jgi:hypothetical protein
MLGRGETGMKKKLSEIDKIFGPVCKVCGIRHIMLSTPGHNLPKGTNLKCTKK